MIRLVIISLVLLVGTARAETPKERATAIVDAQRAHFIKGTAGIAPFLQSLDQDGIVIGEMAAASPKELLAASVTKAGRPFLDRSIDALFKDPSSKPTTKATVVDLVVGARPDAMWFTFDLLIDQVKGDTIYRITELAVDRGGWKVVLFHIDPPLKDKWDDVDMGATGEAVVAAFPKAATEKPGALASLAATPTKLGKALVNELSTVVSGSSLADHGRGANAVKLVAGWSKLKLEHVVSIEQTTKTWGYAVVRVDMLGKGTQRMRLFATIIGVPRADGTWQVVNATYSRIWW